MIITILLSFFGLSCLASMIVFAACVASSRADRIQRGAFEHAGMGGELSTANGQGAVATSQLTLSPSV